MNRTEILAFGSGHPPWSVYRSEPEPGVEALFIAVNAEFDMGNPADRVKVGQIADALRRALDTSIHSWAGGGE